MAREPLHTTQLGESGSRVVFCHGLFGQGRNFTAIGKALADHHRVTLVDMPDHGQSPWSDHFDYLAAADQVAELLSADDPVALVGHSMGGKISMLVALRHPELVERLVRRRRLTGALRPRRRSSTATSRRCARIDLDTLAAAVDAEAALREAVPDPTVRGFLLQSLRREGGPLALAAQPRAPRPRPRRHHRLARGPRWPAPRRTTGRCCGWAAPTRRTCATSTPPAMDRWFPRNRRVTVKGAGHWVHSEQPEVFIEVLRRFLEPNARASAGGPGTPRRRCGCRTR